MLTPGRLVCLALFFAVAVSRPQSTLAQQKTAEIVAAVDPVVVTILTETGQGSGFLIDDQGTIVTNYHVIEGDKQVEVVFTDNKKKKSYPAKGFVALSVGKDLALVRAELPADRVKPLKLAGQVPKKGEQVLAFGAPIGLPNTVTDGIVSAIRDGRELRELPGEYTKDLDAVWIQTSTPISSGNSGGPLVNMRGEVVGVNTWSRVVRKGDANNLNFAISSIHVAHLLATSGKVRPFSELPPPRRKRPLPSPSTPPLAPSVPPSKPFQLGKGTLAEQIAALKTHIEQRREAFAEFSARAKTILMNHPAHAEYKAAMAVSKVVRAELTSVDGQIVSENQAWAQAKTQHTGITLDLDRQQRVNLQNAQAEYQQKVNMADPLDVPFIEADLQRQRNLISIRYDALRRDARTRYARIADGFKLRVDELTNHRLTIESTKLAPLMVKAQPYINVKKEVEEQQKKLEREITRYVGQLNQLEARAKREQPLSAEDAEAAANKAMKRALTLLERNPVATYQRLAELATKYPTSDAALKAKELLMRYGKIEPRSLEGVAIRTWNSLDGNYQVEAKYAGYKSGKVGLKKADGKVVAVPLEKLSEADRRYVLGLPGK